jgi:acetyl esterase/lipase
VLSLLSGCTGTGAVLGTNALPVGETSASQSSESSPPDPNVVNVVSETGTPAAAETSSPENNGNSAPTQTVESGVEMTEVGSQQELIYLWDEGNIPTTTVYTENPNSQYFDPPDFRPNMVYFPAKPGVAVKGAVLICAGGAFRFRGDANEGTPVAKAFSELGYQSFVVNYRLRPYSMQEGALDLGRAVRYVHSHAQEYGIDEQGMPVIGFSGGGHPVGRAAVEF